MRREVWTIAGNSFIGFLLPRTDDPCSAAQSGMPMKGFAYVLLLSPQAGARGKVKVWCWMVFMFQNLVSLALWAAT